MLSGDTRPVSGIAKAARGADLLVHEATFITRDRAKAHTSGHSTALEAAELAAEARVGALALTHLPDRYERGQIMREAAAAYTPILVPHDLDRLEIEPVARPRAPERGVGWAAIRVERDSSQAGSSAPALLLYAQSVNEPRTDVPGGRLGSRCARRRGRVRARAASRRSRSSSR